MIILPQWIFVLNDASMPILNKNKHIMFSKIKGGDIQRYGKGFSLLFWLSKRNGDQYTNFKISMYVSKDEIERYKNKNLLLDVIDYLDEYEKLFLYLNIADLQVGYHNKKPLI